MRTAQPARRTRKRTDDIPATASRTCPHGVDHPSWCPTCRVHWQARMRHPSWPRATATPR